MAKGNWNPSTIKPATRCFICGYTIKKNQDRVYLESVDSVHPTCGKDRFTTPYFMPLWVKNGLLSAFGKTHRLNENDFWPIWEDKLDLWLCNTLGICTNEPEYKIGAFTVKFDWRIQKWSVQ